MSRATFKLVMAIGLLLNSALYFVGVLLVAVVTRAWFATYLDLSAIGVTYLSYVFNFAADHEAPGDTLARLARGFVFASVALGVLAGLALF